MQSFRSPSLDGDPMPRCHRRLLLPLLVLTVFPVGRAAAQDSTRDAKAVAEIRATVRRYDEALRRADVAAAERVWASEYVFVNPHGERLTRADRIANLRGARTSFDSLAPVPEDERIRLYGDSLAVHTTLLAIGGRYSGRATRGQYRALVVWVKRQGRWQQVASQLTPIVTGR
jgi:ketosteroid isomerase-like protein